MTNLGAPPAPPRNASPGNPSSPDIPLWMVAGATGVALCLAMALTFVILKPDHHPRSADPSQIGRVFPDHWDHRIAPLATIAEKERGLTFKHPVGVRFLGPAAFEKSVTTDESSLTKADRADVTHFTGLMRAFGLIHGRVDLFRAFNDFSGSATLAYYSFRHKSITVRGHRLTPAVRATLVHELTHVLQDQYFHVGRRLHRLAKAEKDGPSTSRSGVLQAVIEGDAQRVEALYRASLPRRQRAALDASQRRESAQAGPALSKIPPVVVTMQTSPYTLGEGLMETVAAHGGNQAVDQVFRHPPAHETALLDPFRVVSGDTGATQVAVPATQPGEKEFDSGELGVLTWYFMLAERLPIPRALAAADGWGGDAYVGYDRHGTSCARITYAGRTPQDTTTMYSALQSWIAASPGTRASVTRVGSGLSFQSCDPGTAATGGPDSSQRAMDLVTVRTSIGLGLLRSGVSATVAPCIADRMTQVFPVRKLVDPGFARNDPAVQARVRALAASCA